MTARISAGLLMYRIKDGILEVFLVHPGGPFFKNKPRIWGIPKGELHDAEDKHAAAKREFSEETGIKLHDNVVYRELGFTVNPSGKIIYAWAFEDGTFDPNKLVSNPSKFGWPEIEKGDYFPLSEAKKIIFPAQEEFLLRLEALDRADKLPK